MRSPITTATTTSGRFATTVAALQLVVMNLCVAAADLGVVAATAAGGARHVPISIDDGHNQKATETARKPRQ